MQQDNRAPQIFNQLFTKMCTRQSLSPEMLRADAIATAKLTVEILDILDGGPPVLNANGTFAVYPVVPT